MLFLLFVMDMPALKSGLISSLIRGIHRSDFYDEFLVKHTFLFCHSSGVKSTLLAYKNVSETLQRSLFWSCSGW